MQERLAAARHATDGLQRHRSALVREIRRSLDRLRAHRYRLFQARPSLRRRPGTEDGLQQCLGLTARETEVARLLAEGGSNEQVARELGISAHTARHHTQHVLVKLGVHSRSQAGALIRRQLDVIGTDSLSE